VSSIIFALCGSHIVFAVCILLSIVFGMPSLYRFSARFLYRTCMNLEENFCDIPTTPCILVSNYSAKNNILGYLANATIPVKISMIFSNAFTNTLSRVYVNILNRLYEKDALICISKQKGHGNYQKLKDDIADRLAKNYYIFCYVEDLPSERRPYKIKKLRSGIFNIAKELSVPIVPIVTDSIPTLYGITTFSKFRIVIGEPKIVENPKDTMKNVLMWMQKKLKVMSIRF
jgi:1-acyl-sn-glycerol-3-phosphate acyltransferase